MISIQNLNFSIGGKPLFADASASVPPRTTVGVIGRNGCGKSTLFKLIRGELTPDGGEIEVPRQARIGGVAQEAPASDVSLLDTVLAADIERSDLLARAETETDPNEIANIQTRLADIEAHSAEARASSILQGLGFDSVAQRRACSEFSGGWRMRVALAAVLFSAPDLLLLDEPTNYLDLEGTVWLENFLTRYPHTCLIISHDRDLLNRSVKGVLHCYDGQMTYYTGGYDAFDAARRAKLEQQVALKRKQDLQRAHIQSFVDRFRAQATKARQAQSRIKMLERMQPITAISENAVAEFSFKTPEDLPPPLITVSDGVVGYDGPPVLSKLNFRIDQEDRIALLGANGEGKSTLSKLIAGKLPMMEGTSTRSKKLRIGYFAQHQLDELRPEESALQHLTALRPDETPAKLRARLGAAGFGADLVDLEAKRLSGGQKARLLMMLATLDIPHLLILDEPTNHLDIESRDALMHALNGYGGAIILVSHDPHLVEAVADKLWLVGGGEVNNFDGDMSDYRKLLLGQRGVPDRATKERKSAGKPDRSKSKQPKAAPAPQRSLAALRSEAKKCEERLEKLNRMLKTIDDKLGDGLQQGMMSATEVERVSIKRAEVVEAVDRAEALWLAALERVEAAEAA